MEKIKLGIIGTGQIIHDAYLPIMPFLKNIDEIRLYDLDYNSPKNIINEFQIWLQKGVFKKEYSHYFSDAHKKAEDFYKKLRVVEEEELINSSNTILITTPPATHIDLAIKCSEYNKDIILEKPLAVSIEEIESLPLKIQEKLKKNVRYLENFIFNPAYRELKNKINSGQIGDILLLETCLANTGPSQYEDKPFWRISKNEGGGALLDWGPHTIALSLYLAGLDKEIKEIKTKYINFSQPNEKIAGKEITAKIDLDSLINIILSSRDNTITNLLIENSWKNNSNIKSPQGRSWIRVEGTLGSYMIEIIKNKSSKEYHLTYNQRRGISQTEILPIQFPHDSFYYGLKTIFESEILPEYCTFDFGLNILKIINKILKQEK